MVCLNIQFHPATFYNSQQSEASQTLESKTCKTNAKATKE
jgi:hypothetical protein